jgi:N-acetylneuraminic acid mutarotase
MEEESAPSSRSEVAAATLGASIYVLGGFDGAGESLRTVEIFDTGSGSWDEGPDLPVGLNHPMAAATSDSVYVFGGYLGFVSDATADVHRLDGDDWQAVTPMPESRAAAAAATVDGSVYIIGGMGGPGDESSSMVEEMLVYDVASDSWMVEPGPPTPREHVTAAVVGGRIYVVGGRGHEGNTAVAEAYDPASGEWESLDDMPTARSGLSVVAACDRYVIVAGGEDIGSGQDTYDEVEAYDVETGTWESLPPMPTGRHGLAGGAVGSRLYTLAGGPDTGLSVSDVAESLDLSELDGCP